MPVCCAVGRGFGIWGFGMPVDGMVSLGAEVGIGDPWEAGSGAFDPDGWWGLRVGGRRRVRSVGVERGM